MTSSVASFDYDVNVSLFETIIRVLGGLLSAHMLLVDNATLSSDYNACHPEMPFHYDGHLLRLAVDLADRLLLAFRENGLAFGTVNLRYGVPKKVVAGSLSDVGNARVESRGHRVLAAGDGDAFGADGQPDLPVALASLFGAAVCAAKRLRPAWKAH